MVLLMVYEVGNLFCLGSNCVSFWLLRVVSFGVSGWWFDVLECKVLCIVGVVISMVVVVRMYSVVVISFDFGELWSCVELFIMCVIFVLFGL